MEPNKKSTEKRILLWFGGIIVLVGIVMLLWQSGSNSPSVGESSDLKVPVSSADWSTGTFTAPITLVEYSDFQCPACGLYYPVLKQLTKDFPEKIRFVYRNFPLSQLHANAQLAAQAAEAAGLQGKFWEMHDLLFENQRVWSDQKDALDTFIAYAQTLGLDQQKFKLDVNSALVKESVDSDFKGGIDAKVNGTPTFFLNGKKITNPQSYDEFKTLIEQTNPGNS